MNGSKDIENGRTRDDLAINFYCPDRVYYRGSSKHCYGV